MYSSEELAGHSFYSWPFLYIIANCDEGHAKFFNWINLCFVKCITKYHFVFHFGEVKIGIFTNCEMTSLTMLKNRQLYLNTVKYFDLYIFLFMIFIVYYSNETSHLKNKPFRRSWNRCVVWISWRSFKFSLCCKVRSNNVFCIISS